jgi:geranylgeranyl diphosphate synthase type II
MIYKEKELLEMVAQALNDLPYDRKPASLYEPMRYVLAIGGKRIRPMLMLMSYNMFKDNPQAILTQALAIETFHNFTLLHDDLMDNADLRRGRPTVHRHWDANTAILSGDNMLVMAFSYMQKCPPRHMPQVMQLFTETALLIDEGQQYDMDFEARNDVAEEEYIEMIRLKTSVLLACALKIGAILADAPAADADLLYDFGERLGLAFQLQDDLLDVYGDESVFGKAIGGDITSNKKTYMLINAFNRANDRQRKELQMWVDAKDFDRQEKIRAVTSLYDEIGIRQLCEDKIRQYFDEAKNLLDSVNVSPDHKQQLRQYTLEMMNRQA